MNIDAFDLNLLKALVAIYEERQITAAADRLGMTQPGLSHTLSRLRATFSDDLFIRVRGGMKPTAAAEDLYARIRPGLKQLQAGIYRPTAVVSESLDRTFVLGMNDYGASVILPMLIRLVATTAPRVRLKTRHYAHGEQYDDLRAGNIDLSISVSGEYPGWANAEILFEETARVVGDADNPFLKNGLDVQTYVACPHVIMGPDGADSNWIDAYLSDIGMARTVQHVVPHFLAIPPIILGSSMISTLPARIAERLGQSNGLQSYALPFAAAPHQIVQIWPRRVDRDPLHKWLRETVASAMR